MGIQVLSGCPARDRLPELGVMFVGKPAPGADVRSASAPPLAAMAGQAGISPKALDFTALQARLREHGAILNV